ncbi:unnamed protein product, partial [Symbiodinium sp. CCMP2592]
VAMEVESADSSPSSSPQPAPAAVATRRGGQGDWHRLTLNPLSSLQFLLGETSRLAGFTCRSARIWPDGGFLGTHRAVGSQLQPGVRWLLVDEHEIAAHDSPHLAVPPSPLVAEVPQREVAPELPPATSSPPAEVSLPCAASLATRGSSPLPEPTGPPMSFHPRNRGPPAQVEHS